MHIPASGDILPDFYLSCLGPLVLCSQTFKTYLAYHDQYFNIEST